MLIILCSFFMIHKAGQTPCFSSVIQSKTAALQERGCGAVLHLPFCSLRQFYTGRLPVYAGTVMSVLSGRFHTRYDYSALIYLATISSKVPLSFFTAMAYSSSVKDSSRIFSPSVSATKVLAGSPSITTASILPWLSA